MVALPLTTKISSSTSLTNESTVEEAAFGDGYSAESTRMNPDRQVWSVVWENVSSADAKTLKTFFRANLGVTIEWTPPDEDAAFDFRIKGNLGYKFDGGDARTVSMTLRQVFDDV